MRGANEEQGFIFTYLSPEQRVPQEHPLRIVKCQADAVLKGLNRTFDGMYAQTGRPSIPPERLLKSMLLMALYSMRSDRLFCESLDYNILFRWFLDMSLEERSFDHSTFSKNRDRLIKHEVAREFFATVVTYARTENLLSDEHFTVDGTLIEAYASMKSFVAKGKEQVNNDDDDPSNPSVDFHGEKRNNATHASTTDPDARLIRKGKGKEAKLSYSCNALMENRHGLCVDVELLKADGNAERDAALAMLDRLIKRDIEPKTLGADKGYHAQEFVTGLLTRCVKPHIAMIAGRKTQGLDSRTAKHKGYQVSQRKRKLVEEIFGWIKTVGNLRKTRFRGLERVREQCLWVLSAYNLLRIGRLLARAA